MPRAAHVVWPACRAFTSKRSMRHSLTTKTAASSSSTFERSSSIAAAPVRLVLEHARRVQVARAGAALQQVPHVVLRHLALEAGLHACFYDIDSTHAQYTQ